MNIASNAVLRAAALLENPGGGQPLRELQLPEADATLESPAVCPQFGSPASSSPALRVTGSMSRFVLGFGVCHLSLTVGISLIIAANLHSAVTQSSPTP